MISVDTSKQTSASSSPLSMGTDIKEEGGSTLSFSELLKGVSSKKDDKEIQNGALILSLTDTKDVKTSKDTKIDTLLSLLKGEASLETELEPVEINPKLTSALSVDELKGLIKDAKEYLKGQILQSEGFKKSEIAALPKTLKGLAAVAKKFDINISKITMEEVQGDVKVAAKGEIKISTPEAKIAITAKEQAVVKEDVKSTKGELKELLKKDFRTEKHTEQKSDVKEDNKPVAVKRTDIKEETKSVAVKRTDVKEETKSVAVKRTDIKEETKSVAVKRTDVKEETKSVAVKRTDIKEENKKAVSSNNAVKVIDKKDVNTDETEVVSDDIDVRIKAKSSKPSISSKQIQDVPDDVKQSEQIKTEQSRQEIIKELPKAIKSEPLFKVQASKEITTEQLVNTKAAATEVKAPKQKAQETLKMLLRGDKAIKSEGNMTADFSVATARVIAPKATTEASKSLESLLNNDPSDNAQKLDGANVSKADSFEVKLNEAKQMTKYLSSDVKNAIEDYKSPFTRIKVQLNPQRLGEVDLTIVQRGKNLHINLSSNNAAINTLSMNVNDLKMQLSSNGINNATLNFNNNSQDSESGFNGQQQQNSHREKEAKNEYEHFEIEEKNEEILSSLEIVVPYYV